ncbi:hypothetical protein, partial [Klebsiella pneumoniae]|uniref:hypothetical protein n=1 Tax=Klebsiella pneumoniae TaxID=573 RepID=UPI001A9108C0
PTLLTRDMAVMAALTVALFVLGRGRQGQPGQITRWQGGLLLTSFAGYTGWLLYTSLGTTG